MNEMQCVFDMAWLIVIFFAPRVPTCYKKHLAIRINEVQTGVGEMAHISQNDDWIHVSISNDEMDLFQTVLNGIVEIELYII